MRRLTKSCRRVTREMLPHAWRGEKRRAGALLDEAVRRPARERDREIEPHQIDRRRRRSRSPAPAAANNPSDAGSGTAVTPLSADGLPMLAGVTPLIRAPP